MSRVGLAPSSTTASPNRFVKQKSFTVPPSTASNRFSYGNVVTALEREAPKAIPKFIFPKLDFKTGITQAPLLHCELVYASIIFARGVAAYMRRIKDAVTLKPSEGTPGFKGFVRSVITGNWADAKVRTQNFLASVNHTNEIREKLSMGVMSWTSWFFGSSILVGGFLRGYLPGIKPTPRFSEAFKRSNYTPSLEDIEHRQGQITRAIKSLPEHMAASKTQALQQAEGFFENHAGWRKAGGGLGQLNTIFLLAIVMNSVSMLYTSFCVNQAEKRQGKQLA